jgi:aryl-alcohol dehydrogenase-like predicted oxidoreductase
MRVELRPGYSVSRVIKGGWQLAGGHGRVDEVAAIADMGRFVDAGITTFDCADIYTGVEDLIGRFRTQTKAAIQVHTKYVPNLQSLPTVDRAATRLAIERSLTRLRAEALDLVQLHWWDYAEPRFVEVAGHLEDLRREGLIRHIGATNFASAELAAILDAGVEVVSHQVQYSLVDRRCAGEMAELAMRRGFALVCYGALLGGFLHERWRGVPPPLEPLENRSLVKYRLVIDEYGGWDAFQRLLDACASIAHEHDASIGAVGIAWTLSRPLVKAVIVGARNAAHLAATLGGASLRLDAEDLATLDALAGPGPSGDVYALERDRDGRHGRIMKYNLGAAT